MHILTEMIVIQTYCNVYIAHIVLQSVCQECDILVHVHSHCILRESGVVVIIKVNGEAASQ